MTFSAFIKKEWYISSKDSTLITLLVVFLFFAIFTPFILKLLPNIIAKEFGSDIANLFQTSALDSITFFLLRYVPYIFITVLSLSLGGILCNETTRGTLISPILKGSNKKIIVLSKFTFYSIVLFVISTVSVFSNIYYSFTLFESELPSLLNILLCCFYIYLYIIFIIALLFFFSSFLNKGVTVALFTAGINILLSLLSSFNFTFNPFMLILNGSQLSGEFITTTSLITFIFSIILILFSVYFFNKQNI